MRKSCMKDKCLRFAKGVNYTVQKSNKERGVKVHRTRSIQQNDEAQRLDLAASPGQLYGGSTMLHVAMDSPPQVEPPPAPTDLLTAK